MSSNYHNSQDSLSNSETDFCGVVKNVELSRENVQSHDISTKEDQSPAENWTSDFKYEVSSETSSIKSSINSCSNDQISLYKIASPPLNVKATNEKLNFESVDVKHSSHTILGNKIIFNGSVVIKSLNANENDLHCKTKRIDVNPVNEVETKNTRHHWRRKKRIYVRLVVTAIAVFAVDIYLISRASKATETCTLFEWKRDNGQQCVKSDEKCDGTVHCHDRSDETVEQCASNYCPSHAFRYEYGGCVDAHAICGICFLRFLYGQ